MLCEEKLFWRKTMLLVEIWCWWALLESKQQLNMGGTNIHQLDVVILYKLMRSGCTMYV